MRLKTVIGNKVSSGLQHSSIELIIDFGLTTDKKAPDQTTISNILKTLMCDIRAASLDFLLCQIGQLIL